MQLYSGGAEAVESALRLAKCHTGKYEFVSFWGGFHGKTMGVLSLMGSDFKDKLGPMVPGTHIVPVRRLLPLPAEARVPDLRPGLRRARAQADQDEHRRRRSPRSSSSRCRASAGNIIPPKEFLPAVSELADELGALLIADEMITGFGRTGKYWGVEHSGVKPDIVTIGKQFGGGFPRHGPHLHGRDRAGQALVAIRRARPRATAATRSSRPPARPPSGSSTKKTSSRTPAKWASISSKKLLPFVDAYPFIGEVRGAGLFLAIEMVKDKKTKEPLAKAHVHRVFMEFCKRGLLTMAYDASFRIQPAMTIDEATIDEAVAIMQEVFDDVKANWRWAD